VAKKVAKVDTKRLTSKAGAVEYKAVQALQEEFSKASDGKWTPDVTSIMYKEWLPRIFAGVMEQVRDLPTEHKSKVLKGMGCACGEWAIPIIGIKPGQSLEEYLNCMALKVPPLGPRKFIRVGDDGNIIDYKFILPRDKDGKAVCLCPLVSDNMFNLVRKKQGDPNPLPEICACSANTVKCWIKQGTGIEVDHVEVLSSVQVNDGSDCHFLVRLKPSAFSTPKDEP